MNQELTQRVIGAIVVTALAAVFIPMLFDDPVDNRGQIVSEIPLPEQPVIVDAPMSPPSSVEDVTNRSKESTVAGNNNSSLSNQELLAEPDDASIEKNFTDEQDQGRVEMDVEEADELPASNRKIEQPNLNSKPKPDTLSPHKLNNQQTIVSTVVKPVIGKPLIVDNKSPAKATKNGTELVRWYLQAGSFTKKENAVSLSESLRRQGMPVLLDTIQVADKGTFYRLRVGPELDKKRAIAMQQKLIQQNIDSILQSE